MRYQEIREELARRLAQLERRGARIEGDRRHESVPVEGDFEEQAIQMENDEVLDALDASVRREALQVRAALARIDDGSYGRCRSCGGEIAEGRLRALPTADLCVECAE
jgi:RNA polymerase-binding transcription factor